MEATGSSGVEWFVVGKLCQDPFGSELRMRLLDRPEEFILQNLKQRPKLGKHRSGDAAEASASLSGKLVDGWSETMEAVGQMKAKVLKELAEKYELHLEGIRTCEEVELAVIIPTRPFLFPAPELAVIIPTGNIFPEVQVKEMVLKELKEACHSGGDISPELRRALGLQETPLQLCQFEIAIGWIEAYGLEKTVESYQIIGQLKARILREVAMGCYTEQSITQLMEQIDKYHAFYLEPICKGLFQKQPESGQDPRVVIVDPFDREFSNPPALIKQLLPKLATTAFGNSGHAGYTQSSTSSNGSQQTLENEFVIIKIGHDKNLDESEIKDGVPMHIANALNAVVEALKVPGALLEGNKINVSAYNQVALTLVLASGSLNSGMSRFFPIAAVTGYLGSLWAMYLQKNQVLANWLSKIGAIGTTSAVIVALLKSFADEKNYNAFASVVTLACILTGAIIIRSK